MAGIVVTRQPREDQLKKIGVRNWAIWTREESEFPWHYDEKETCYFLEGEVAVIPEVGRPVEVGAGDLVIFPQGLSCTWKVKKAVRKHYRFG